MRNQADALKRKRHCSILRWSVFTTIIVCHLLQIVAWVRYDSYVFAETANALSFSVLTLVVLFVTIAMSIAFGKFIKIVRGTKQKADLNRCYIFVQIVGLTIWTVIYFLEGISVLTHVRQEEKTYEPVRNILILDSLSFWANIVNFSIIAVVIYQSDKVAR